MRVIYEPKGRAREYAALACNLFRGCPHGCKYCFAPGCLRMKADDFHGQVEVRADVLQKLAADVGEMAAAGDEREVLFCFTSDPFPASRPDLWQVTENALALMMRHRLNVTVLTKNPAAAVLVAKEMYKKHGWCFRLGVTLTGWSNEYCREWETNAPTALARVNGVYAAGAAGIPIWVSLEPVIDPYEALEVIHRLRDYVKCWKIGKINHNRALEEAVDWREFCRKAGNLLRGHNVYWKDSLKPYLPAKRLAW